MLCDSPRERARVYVALLTWLRQGEALGLRWDDVHLDPGDPWMHIHQEAQRVKGQGVKILPRTKTDEERSSDTPISP